MKKLKITLLDRYIIGKFAGTFFYTLAIFLAIAVIFDFSEKLDDFLDNKAPAWKIITDYYFNFIPYYASMLSPLLIFIAVVFFTSRMAGNTEIVAILSSGVSFRRLLYPYLLTGIFLAILIFIFNGYIIPDANKERIAFENSFINNPYVYKDKNIHMQLDSQTYIYLESYNNTDNIGYRFALEKFRDKRLELKLLSDRIRWDSASKHWTIENYSIRYIGQLEEKMIRGYRKDTLLDFSPKDFERKDNSIETMTNTELDQYIAREQLRGSTSLEPYIIEKYKRYAMPFSTFILILIGVSLSSRKVRGGIGIHLGAGIGYSFAYILLMQFTTTFAIKGGLHPLISVWIPNVLFGIFGLYLLRIAPK